MNAMAMTSLERVLKTLGHQEPDRVPLFLMLTMHGAKELGLSIREYFSRPEHVIEGQLRLGQKFQNDCLCPFFYAAIEPEVFGGEVVWVEDGPPNSGEPFIRNIEQIDRLKLPDVKSSKILQKVFKAIEGLKQEVGDQIPIIGTVMSPFSLPVMQMGFDKYLEVMRFHPELFNRLIQINKQFCVNYANAQLAAGATAICYSDPVSSTAVIPRETYLKTGFLIASQTISMIKGPVFTHLVSGRGLEIVDEIAKTGTVAIGVSSHEDIGAMKAACRGKLTVLGNMNDTEMRTWNSYKTTQVVMDIIRKAAPGGGFILSDSLGEIPYQVSDEILMTISETLEIYGQYPITTS
jgi:uroporphyrinogen decarboxylase